MLSPLATKTSYGMLYQRCRRFVIPGSLILWLSLFAAIGTAQTPVISEGGVVNAADYSPQVAPGMIIAIFGSDLAPGTKAASSIPLPVALLDVNIEVTDGARVLPAPLFFVSANQINAQLPFDQAGTTVGVRVRRGGQVSNEVGVAIVAAAPRLFTKTLDGRGEAILTHADYSVVSAENPAVAGEWVVLYLTGLGAVTPSIAAGQPGGDNAGLGELNRVVGEVTATVGGQPAAIYFAGLAPGFAGLYQLNLQIPETTIAGSNEIVVRAGDAGSQEPVILECALSITPLASENIGQPEARFRRKVSRWRWLAGR